MSCSGGSRSPFLSSMARWRAVINLGSFDFTFFNSSSTCNRRILEKHGWLIVKLLSSVTTHSCLSRYTPVVFFAGTHTEIERNTQHYFENFSDLNSSVVFFTSFFYISLRFHTIRLVRFEIQRNKEANLMLFVSLWEEKFVGILKFSFDSLKNNS